MREMQSQCELTGGSEGLKAPGREARWAVLQKGGPQEQDQAVHTRQLPRARWIWCSSPPGLVSGPELTASTTKLTPLESTTRSYPSTFARNQAHPFSVYSSIRLGERACDATSSKPRFPTFLSPPKVPSCSFAAIPTAATGGHPPRLSLQLRLPFQNVTELR